MNEKKPAGSEMALPQSHHLLTPPEPNSHTDTFEHVNSLH